MSSIRPVFASLFVALALSGCGGGPNAEELQKGVETAVQAKDWPGAIAKADEALKNDAIAKDPAKAWRFESLKLNAQADAGKGADVKAGLERLGGAYDKQLTGALYRSLAQKLKDAGDAAGSVDILDAGSKKFPGDASFAEAIEAAKQSADPAEVERLKALGYL